MRVIVTRPAAQSAEWVAGLAAYGIEAVALPLIGIAPARDVAPVDAAWRALPRYRLVVFVSPNAVEQFFAHRPDGAAWPSHLLGGSPGPGTTQALSRQGVPRALVVAPAADAPQFDSEALWRRLRGHDWRQAPVLIVRGDGGREWLADTLALHGAQVELLAAYRREAPRWTAPERAVLDAALGAPGSHLWCFSSSEAIDHLSACAGEPASRWQDARALASHPRIAERARRLGFGSVAETRPPLAAVAACIQSMRS